MRCGTTTIHGQCSISRGNSANDRCRPLSPKNTRSPPPGKTESQLPSGLMSVFTDASSTGIALLALGLSSCEPTAGVDVPAAISDQDFPAVCPPSHKRATSRTGREGGNTDTYSIVQAMAHSYSSITAVQYCTRPCTRPCNP